MAVPVENAVEVAYREYVQKIYRFCLWRTNSAHDAEDITTDVFVKLLAGKAENVGPDRLLTWLIKVADNECKLLFRKRRRLDETAFDQDSEDAGPDTRPWISPEICRAVNSLKRRPKTVLFLKAVERLTFKEIADTLGISEGAAKMSFYRATKRLSTLLREAEDD